MAMSRILIVEDDLANLYALRAMFEREGWQVGESKTAAATLAQLDPPPDWIVLDLGLADGDGEDVLRYVREAGIASQVAIVSGRLDPERIARLRTLRADVLFEKPIRFEELLKACTAEVKRTDPDDWDPSGPFRAYPGDQG